jgi:aminotransferase in exopolysaccharide biosynthesis
MIPLSVPSIQGNEWQYIKECLDTEWVSSVGKYVELFEQRIAQYTGAQHAIACVNGTAALHVALSLAGVQAGDEVIVPTLTFIAPVNAVSYLSAVPVFMDCDRYYNIDGDKVISFLKDETEFLNGFTRNCSTGRRISAIIPVHIFGNAVFLDELTEICLRRNIKIIEDATESLGTRYIRGKFAGRHCGTVGTLGCLSFNGNKIITTGGGGMILTDNPALADRARYLTTQAKDEGIRYVHNEIGYNYRLTNIQAAMGVAQLEQLPTFLKIKKEIFKTYKNGANKVEGLQVADVPDYADNNHWLTAIQIDKDAYGKNREELMAHLLRKGIESRPIWHLNHLQKPYINCQQYEIEKALELLDITLNIPSSVNIKSDQVDFVITVLEKNVETFE